VKRGQPEGKGNPCHSGGYWGNRERICRYDRKGRGGINPWAPIIVGHQGEFHRRFRYFGLLRGKEDIEWESVKKEEMGGRGRVTLRKSSLTHWRGRGPPSSGIRGTGQPAKEKQRRQSFRSTINDAQHGFIADERRGGAKSKKGSWDQVGK